MDLNKRKWNDDLKSFRNSLKGWDSEKIDMNLLSLLHAAVHESSITGGITHSFFDEMLEGVKEDAFAVVPEKQKHSFAYHIWHTTRIEDISIVYIIGKKDQILDSGNWMKKINSDIRHTGNSLTRDEVIEFSEKVNILQLLAYRREVAKETQSIINSMNPLDLKIKVKRSNYDEILENKDVLSDDMWLIDYWTKKDFSGLFLMPATRHHILHISDALKYKKKIVNNDF